MPRHPIIAYCWLDVRPFVGAPILNGDLLSEAQQAGDNPFLIHDDHFQRSAVVVPDAVRWAIENRFLPLDAAAGDTGLLDTLSEGQVVVERDAPASDVVRQAVASGISVVIAVDSMRQPEGVFVPSSVQARLLETLANRSDYSIYPGIQGALARLGSRERAGDPAAPAGEELIQAIDALDEALDEFHSENLNSRNPAVGLCNDHGLRHVTALPCATHGAGLAYGVVEMIRR